MFYFLNNDIIPANRYFIIFIPELKFLNEITKYNIYNCLLYKTAQNNYRPLLYMRCSIPCTTLTILNIDMYNIYYLYKHSNCNQWYNTNSYWIIYWFSYYTTKIIISLKAVFFRYIFSIRFVHTYVHYMIKICKFYYNFMKLVHVYIETFSFFQSSKLFNYIFFDCTFLGYFLLYLNWNECNQLFYIFNLNPRFYGCTDNNKPLIWYSIEI